jgi:outer membrane protein OmpA-like peptidoglycan-associated protein
MESRFAHDLSGVRVHHDGRAAAGKPVSEPGDLEEVEAERVTAAVSRRPGSASEHLAAPSFASVRIHTDGLSAGAADAIDAAAYTVGHNIVFGRGRFAPGTPEGQRLLAHELVHVIQQGGPAVEAATMPAGTMRIARVPKKGGIPKDYGFSTHCGWIDWGHADGVSARALIADVRAKSQALHRSQTAKEEPPGIAVVRPNRPDVGVTDPCPADYESGERTASASPATATITPVVGTPDATLLAGFEVGQSDASRFGGAAASLAAALESDPQLSLELWGCSDCMGQEGGNLTLRAQRALAVRSLLPEAAKSRGNVTTFVPMNRFVTSNATREGRRQNRSVVARLVRPLKPELVLYSQKSGAMGITVHHVMMGAQILKPLTPDEELSVALGIFQLVSTAFETAQFSTNVLARSAFSEEDLPSNLIGFYKAARGLKRGDVERICGVWNESDSKKRFEGYTFSENRSFTAARLIPGGSWPADFTTITPAPEGSLWQMQFMQIIAAGKVTNIP